MLSPLDLSLINGPIPVAATVAGVLALIALSIRKSRTWWTRIVPAVVLACTAAMIGLKLLVDHVWKPWPEPLPPILAVWAGAALLAVCLAVARLRAGRWYWRLLSLPLVLVVTASAVTAANAYFGFYPTSRAVLELFTNNRREAVGPSLFKVPSLVGVGGRAPYMHDGCAATLRDRFGACGGGDKHGHTSQLSETELGDLIAYLESL